MKIGYARVSTYDRNLSLQLDALIAERGIGFQPITEVMDTATVGGELLFHVMEPWRSSSAG